MTLRLALAAGVLLILSALAVAFLPTESEGAKCGNWLAPEWTAAKSDKLARDFHNAAVQFEGLNAHEDAVNAESESRAVVHNYLVCSDALSPRRTISLILLGLGLLVPFAIVLVGVPSARSRA